MDEATDQCPKLSATAKQLVRRLLIIGENRLELLTVEVQEERERLLRHFLLVLGVAAFGLLASLTFTAAIVVVFWECAPVAALLGLTVLYGATACYLCRRLTGQLREWQTLSATLEQLRKDRICLEKFLT